MSDWLTEELKYKERMDGYEELRNSSLTVKSVDDFWNVANPRSIRSLNFDKTFSIQSGETLSTILMFWNIEKISFGTEFGEPINPKFISKLIEALPNLEEINFNCGPNILTWKALSEIQFGKIKKLYVRMCEVQKPMRIVAPQLEEFKYSGDDYEKLSPIERMSTLRLPYDFSGMPNLRTVDIRRWRMLDYSSLCVLYDLKKLVIEDRNLTDLIWLSPKYQLECLHVWGEVETLDGIESQPNLRVLDLGHNKLTDIRQVRLLRNLQHLDLRFNPITDVSPIEELDNLDHLDLVSEQPLAEGALRSKGIKSLYLTFADKDFDSINGKVCEFSRYAYYAIKGEDKCDVSSANDFLSRHILAERQKPYEERLRTKIQQEFERLLQAINPFDFRYYNFGYKEEYVRRACTKYPFLKITAEMDEQIKRERNQMLTRVSAIPGLLFAVDDDVVRIYVKVEKGTGKFKQEYDSRYRRPVSVTAARAIQNTVNKNLNIMFPGDSLKDYDVTVLYAPLYGKEVDAKIAFAVIYAIWSALNYVPVRSKSILALRFGASGKIVQADITSRQLNAVKLQGFETVITWGKKNETIHNDGVCLVKCKTTADATQEIFVD